MWACFVITFGEDSKGLLDGDSEELDKAGKICERVNKQQLAPPAPMQPGNDIFFEQIARPRAGRDFRD
jgi:hypothetical protein